MTTYKKIRQRLKIQQKIEGFTPETALLLKILPTVKCASEWNALASVQPHRYGTYSYQSHIFYYPSNVLIELQEILK